MRSPATFFSQISPSSNHVSSFSVSGLLNVHHFVRPRCPPLKVVEMRGRLTRTCVWRVAARNSEAITLSAYGCNPSSGSSTTMSIGRSSLGCQQRNSRWRVAYRLRVDGVRKRDRNFDAVENDVPMARASPSRLKSSKNGATSSPTTRNFPVGHQNRCQIGRIGHEPAVVLPNSAVGESWKDRHDNGLSVLAQVSSVSNPFPDDQPPATRPLAADGLSDGRKASLQQKTMNHRQRGTVSSGRCLFRSQPQTPFPLPIEALSWGRSTDWPWPDPSPRYVAAAVRPSIHSLT